METKVRLVPEKDCFTMAELFAKAAEYKGLRLLNKDSKKYSEIIKTYVLDAGLISILAKQGIEQQPRSDQVFTLVDKNPQKGMSGYVPSNYWNFALVEDSESGISKFNLKISLCVTFHFSRPNRGIGLTPISSSPLISPADLLPNLRMFKALTDNDQNACPLAKEIASSDGVVWVTWTELGLGGIRPLSDLFNEFAGSNQKVKNLALGEDVFDPPPRNTQSHKLSDKLFITEPVQPRVFQAWREQLEKYQRSLNLAASELYSLE